MCVRPKAEGPGPERDKQRGGTKLSPVGESQGPLHNLLLLQTWVHSLLGLDSRSHRP